MEILDRFEAKWVPEPNTGCWLWTATTNDFHGAFWMNGRQQKAHRVAYELYKEPIPKGKQVNHLCSQRTCVNPEHLYIGTQTDNMQDRLRSGGYSSLPRGEDRPDCKLTDADVRAIRSSTNSNISLAKMYSVSDSLISMIKTGKRRLYNGKL